MVAQSIRPELLGSPGTAGRSFQVKILPPIVKRFFTLTNKSSLPIEISVQTVEKRRLISKEIAPHRRFNFFPRKKCEVVVEWPDKPQVLSSDIFFLIIGAIILFIIIPYAIFDMFFSYIFYCLFGNLLTICLFVTFYRERINPQRASIHMIPDTVSYIFFQKRSFLKALYQNKAYHGVIAETDLGTNLIS